MGKIIPMEEQKLLYIKWLDAHADGGWKNDKELEEWANADDCICEDIGWLVYEDEKCIGMAMRRLVWTDSDPGSHIDQCGGLHKIPRTWIVEIREVMLSEPTSMQMWWPVPTRTGP